MEPEWSGVEAFEFAAPEGDAPMVVYENDGVTVEAFRANHEPIHPAVGYRITYSDILIVG
jgi:ribonuclease Z